MREFALLVNDDAGDTTRRRHAPPHRLRHQFMSCYRAIVFLLRRLCALLRRYNVPVNSPLLLARSEFHFQQLPENKYFLTDNPLPSRRELPREQENRAVASRQFAWSAESPPLTQAIAKA